MARDHPDFERVRDLCMSLHALAHRANDFAQGCEDVAVSAAIESIGGVLPMMAHSLAALTNKKEPGCG
jgi:hypothetical protein